MARGKVGGRGWAGLSLLALLRLGCFWCRFNPGPARISQGPVASAWPRDPCAFCHVVSLTNFKIPKHASPVSSRYGTSQLQALLRRYRRPVGGKPSHRVTDALPTAQFFWRVAVPNWRQPHRNDPDAALAPSAPRYAFQNFVKRLRPGEGRCEDLEQPVGPQPGPDVRRVVAAFQWGWRQFGTATRQKKLAVGNGSVTGR